MAPALWVAALLVLGGLPFLLYSNSVHSPFVGDDIDYIEHNPELRQFSLPDYLAKLRPLTKTTYWLNWKIHRKSLPGYHLVNIGLHSAVGIVLFFLFLRLLQNTKTRESARHHAYTSLCLALAGALVYILHPIHSQAVNYTFARSELLCALFLYAALLVHAKKDAAQYGIVRGIAVAVLFLLALASKERAFMFLPLLVLFDLLVRQEETWSLRWRRWLKVGIPLVLVAGLGAINFHLGFQGQHKGAIGAGHDVPEFAPYFLTQFVARFHYLKLYFWPGDLSFDYMFTLRESLLDPVLLLAVAGHLVLFVLALFLARRNGLISFGIFWFFVALLPTSGLAPTAWFIHEHWIYIPSMGFFLIVLALCRSMAEQTGPPRSTGIKRTALILAFAVLCMLLSIATFQRNKVWQSPLSLWEDAKQNAAQRPWLWNQLGIAHLQRCEYDEAIECLKKAEALAGPSSVVHLNIGICLMENGDPDGARVRLSKAQALSPRQPEVLIALGQLAGRMNQPVKAIQYYQEAKNNNAAYPPDYFIQGAVLALKNNDRKKAVEFLRQGLKQYPKSGSLLKKLREIEEEQP